MLHRDTKREFQGFSLSIFPGCLAFCSPSTNGFTHKACTIHLRPPRGPPRPVTSDHSPARPGHACHARAMQGHCRNLRHRKDQPTPLLSPLPHWLCSLFSLSLTPVPRWVASVERTKKVGEKKAVKVRRALFVCTVKGTDSSACHFPSHRKARELEVPLVL
jgi:hypothetical protein